MVTVHLPPQWEIDCEIAGNRVRLLRKPAYTGDATVIDLVQGRRRSFRLDTLRGSPAVVAKAADSPTDGDVLVCAARGTLLLPTPDAEPTSLKWLRPLPLTTMSAAELHARADGVVRSWRGNFELRQETSDLPGLRQPQVGALHAVLAHWTRSSEACTIVMPTGTGKTETMLSLVVSEGLLNVLVIVPSFALREQTAEKFASLGVLPALGVTRSAAKYPVVGILEHGIKTAEQAEAFMRSCNIVIATMSAVTECSAEARLAVARITTHLFIDEAHHIPARTWTAFRGHFPDSTIVQFTATPFRNDGKRVDGRPIYDYPLGRAQSMHMFQNIRFTAVAAFTTESADEEIAARAKGQLARDIADGYDHLVMARAQSISRAESLLALYERVAPEYAPLLIHSAQSETRRRESLRRIRQRTSRILICVNMLGEGFDLPELKIAALHDPHKSLAITLQFIGRFARTNQRIGPATAIANVVDQRVEDSLKQLYAEDSDWNLILRELSEKATRREVERSEFLKRFVPPLDVIPLQNVYPKMSMVAFEIGGARWDAQRVLDALARDDRSELSLNSDDRVVVYVQRNDTPIRWGETRELINTTWELYVLYWCEEQGLLFVNSSDNSELHEDLAALIAGAELPLVRGNVVFRTLSGIKQLILNTLGLTHSLSRAIRFTMHSGADIREGLSEAQTLNAVKVNLFGHGYEDGERASLGCSRKGRIWSHLIAYDLADWLAWCRHIGEKLRDTSISDTTVPSNVLVPTQINERPSAVPLTVEWPTELFEKPEELVEFRGGGVSVPFYDVGFDLVRRSATGPIRLAVSIGTDRTYTFTMQFSGPEMKCVADGDDVELVMGRKAYRLSEWLTKYSPIVRFGDNSFVAYNELFKVDVSHHPPFDREQIETWDWSGVNLHRESQTAAKFADSIQRRVIERVLAHEPAFTIVFDDDDTREAADVVALRSDDENLFVDFYHCKYVHGDAAGARVEDLHEVCGQAQRSIQWRHDVDALLRHLRYRDARRVTTMKVSRFERGDQTVLSMLQRKVRFLRPRFKIHLVQPGISRAKVSVGQLDLLSATAAYLQDTYGVPLGVIASA